MKSNFKSPNPNSLNIIAIGASAGGLEALQDFLSSLPELNNAVILIAQHLSPTHKSMLVQLLSKETKLTVEEASSGTLLAPNKVYITPPDNEITISPNLKIRLQKPPSTIGPKPSVDVLFESLQYVPDNHRVAAIILSGTGSDGAHGIKLLSNRPSFIVAQDPLTAKYDGMPSAAIHTGKVDTILKTKEIGHAVARYFSDQPQIESDKSENSIDSKTDLQKIFKLLGKQTGTDFSNYKSATIGRRLEKRMSQLKIYDIKDYLALVESQPQELDEMFNIILIGVTTFFRDQDAFEALEKELSQSIEKRVFGEQIRIWVPGCSTGEEAYSIAIVLTNLLGEKIRQLNIQIFATDIDERSLTIARKAIYSEESVKALPKNILEKFFVRKGKDFELVKAVRSMVLFSKHDVINNPPFLKLDLISCRNLLIYFNSALQQQVLPIFHYSLNPEGLLFLGKSETVGQFTDLFSSIDNKNKLFRKRRTGNIHKIKFASFKTIKQDLPKESSKIERKAQSLSEAIRDTIFKTFEYPYVVINEAFDIQEVNGDVRLFLSLVPGNIQVNLIKMVNPELQIELRAVLTKAFKEKKIVNSKIKKFQLFGNEYYVRIVSKPLMNVGLYEDLYIVIFQQLEIEEFIQNSSIVDQGTLQNSRIVELEHELLTTKEHLQTYIEEIETANEELQSLNEEMQSTNEELQSSNEELETSNEELQSTNEEIQIAYAELKASNEELERKEALLKVSKANSEALLNNNLQGLLLIDTSYRIIELNQQARHILFDLSGKDISMHDSLIDFLPASHLDQLLVSLRKTISGKITTIELQFKDHKKVLRNYNFNFSPVLVDGVIVNGVSIGILETTEIKNTLSKLNAAEQLMNAVFAATTTGICITDSEGKFVDVNNAYCELYGYSKEELINQSFTMVVPVQYRKKMQQMHDDFFQHEIEIPMNFDVVGKDGKLMKVSTSADLLIRPDGKRYKVTSVRDVTEEKNLQMLVNEALQISKLGAWELDPDSMALAITAHFRSIFSMDKEESLNLVDFISHFQGKDSQITVNNAILKCIETGETFDLEVPLNNPKHQDQWVRIIGKAESLDKKIIRVFGSIQDVSKEKQLENQLSAINRNLPGALLRIILTNKGEEKILFLSEGARNLWNINPLKAIDDNSIIWDLLTSDEEKEIKESLRLSAKKLSPWSKVWSYIDQKGKKRWNKGSGNPSKADDGSIVWDIVVLDITEEFQTKSLLLETEKRFEYLFDEVESLAVQGYDKTGKIKFWNKASENLYGFSRDEAIGKKIWDLIIPDELIPQVKSTIQKMTKTGKSTGAEELYLKHKSGKLVPVYSNHTLITLPGKESEIFCIDIDLSDQKNAESKLKTSESLLNEAQKISKMGNWNFDFTNDLLTWSDGLYDVFGADRNTFLETHGSFVNLIHESHKEFVQQTSKHTQKTGEPFVIQYPITTPDGKEKIIEEHGYAEKDENGKIVRLYGTAQDVTDQIIAKESLKLANQRYEYATKATADILFDFDIKKQLISWGENADQIFGEKIEQFGFITSSNEFMGLFKDPEQMIEEANAAIKNKELIKWSAEKSIRFYNGTYGVFSIKSFLLRNKNGIAYRAIGALQNITKQKNKETRDNILKQIRTIFNSKMPIEESLKEALKVICTFANLEMGELWNTTIDHSSISLVAKYASNQSILQFHEDSKGINVLRKGEGFAGNVWNDNKIQIWTDIGQHTKFIRKSYAKKAGLNTILGAPLTENENVIGVLIFGSQAKVENLNYLKEILSDLESSLSAELMRKKIEIQLKEIFEASPDIICLSGFDGYFKKINPAATKLLGYSEEELTSRPFLEFTHPDDQRKTEAELDLLIEGNETFYFENRYITKSGKVIWLSWSSRSNPSDQLVYAVAKNITEQKRLQQTLDSASTLAQIGGWDVELKTGEIILTKTAKEIYEIEENFDFKRDLVEEFYPEPFKTEFREAFSRCIETGEAFEIESKIKTNTGKEKWVRSIGKIEYENNVPMKIIGSTQDITAIKNFEESLKLLNENLREQTKRLAVSNADLEQFAYIASHDLQEPLRMVSNFMSLLDRKYRDQLDDKAREYIDYAVNGAKKMQAIILDLLEFSRAGRYPEELELIDLNEVVSDVIRLQHKLIEDTKVELNIEKLPKVQGLRLPMIQVFQNLVNNSLKYADPNRKLKITISAEEKNSEWVIKVEDNGQGIPKEYLDKIFIIFQRVNPSSNQKGSGLGLAIVKKIIEKFKGSVWVDSELGKGSTFYFSLPQ